MMYLGESEHGVHPLRVHALIYLSMYEFKNCGQKISVVAVLRLQGREDQNLRNLKKIRIRGPRARALNSGALTIRPPCRSSAVPYAESAISQPSWTYTTLAAKRETKPVDFRFRTWMSFLIDCGIVEQLLNQITSFSNPVSKYWG